VRIEESSSNIVKLSVIRRSRHRASSPYGPVRAGLTTSQITQDQQLTELLNSLESEVATLESKYCTALDTLSTAIQGVRVALSHTQTEEGGTDV
jgi:hypothetical protein